jgi:NO-binding membrane sensor protein with MHYT domain
VLLVTTILPSFAALWYVRRRGVNLQELAENAGARSTLVGILVFGTAMMLTFAAMTCTVFTGQPVLPAPSLEVIPGEGFLGGMARGPVIGGMIGGLAAIIGGALSFRRGNRRHEVPGR